MLHREGELIAHASASVAITAAATGQDLSGRPNILLFMVDDMGWQDTSVKFTPQRTDNNCKYTTPHMERLAGSGMVFTQQRLPWYLAYVCQLRAQGVENVSSTQISKHLNVDSCLEL